MIEGREAVANYLDKELDSLMENMVICIGKLLKKIWYGMKILNKVKNIIGLVICITISYLFYRNGHIWFNIGKNLNMPKFLQQILYVLFLANPFTYLAMLGNLTDKNQKEYDKKFESIGFKEKSGKYPFFVNAKEDEAKRTIYTFKTDISIGQWRKSVEQLETALDCTILKIENKGSKKVVQLLAVSSEYKIPEKLLWNDEYLSKTDGEIVIGQSVLKQIKFNLNRTPHVLAAGETGSGKSVILRCCLWQMILQNAKVYMIDFKGGVEFGLDYEQYGEVITDRKKAVSILEMLVNENEARLALFRQLRVKNLPEYNDKTGKNLSRIGVFCDEIAEMLDKKGVSKEDKPIYERIEGLISTLARLSRATGINLFMGVQRPDANILTGQIKNNIPVRICGRFADKSASEIVLNSTAAINLPDIKGRFLYLMGNELMEFQAYYFDDETMLHSVNSSSSEMLTIESTTCNNTNEEESLVKEFKEEDFDFNFDNQVEWSVKK